MSDDTPDDKLVDGLLVAAQTKEWRKIDATGMNKFFGFTPEKQAQIERDANEERKKVARYTQADIDAA